MKNYSYPHDFGNGTSVVVSNLNVTGISYANLPANPSYPSMESIENSKLFPYLDVRVNVSNMSARGLEGIGVVILANDVTVASSYQFSNTDIGSLLNLLSSTRRQKSCLFMLPLMSDPMQVKLKFPFDFP